MAITQTAWLIGMALWVARFAFYPRPTLYRSPLDYALLGFFILSGISAVFSYSPMMSIGKMRAASLFTIVYLVSQNVQLASLGATACADVDRVVHGQCVFNCRTIRDRQGREGAGRHARKSFVESSVSHEECHRSRRRSSMATRFGK